MTMRYAAHTPRRHLALALLGLLALPVTSIGAETVSPVKQQAINAGAARLEHMDKLPWRKPAVVVEAESLLPHIVASAGTFSRQDMTPFGPGWGGNAQVFWRPPAPVDTPIRNWPNLRMYPQVAQAGRYRVTLVYTAAPDYGSVRVFLKGQPVKDYDGYAPSVVARRLDLGEFQLAAGSFELLGTVFGKNAGASNYYVGLDRIELLPLQ